MNLQRMFLIALCCLLGGCAGAPDAAAVATPAETSTATAATSAPAETASSATAPSPAPSPSPSPTVNPWPRFCPFPDEHPGGGGNLRIAFIGGPEGETDEPRDNAWVWRGLSFPDRITNTDDATWAGLSDDGAFVAYTRETSQYIVNLWVARADGGGAKLLVTPVWFAAMNKHPGKQAIPMDLHWVPGTHTLAFHTNLVFPGPGSPGFFYTPDNLWWVDAETGKGVSRPVDGEVFYSPDGKSAAVVNQGGLFLMNADGTGQRAVDIPDYHTIPFGATYNEPPRIHWASDSRSLLVIAPEARSVVDANAPDAMVTLWRVDASAGTAAYLDRYNADYMTFSFSADHAWAAFRRPFADTENSAPYEQHILRLDGGYKQIYTSTDTNITLSPDGHRYIGWDHGRAFLGSVCADRIPLMDTPWSDPVTREDETFVDVLWLDNAQALIAVGSYNRKFLYLYDLDHPDAGLWKLMDYRVSAFEALYSRPGGG